MSLYVICYELITLYRFKVYLFTLYIVRHSAAACIRLDKYMIFKVVCWYDFCCICFNSF